MKETIIPVSEFEGSGKGRGDLLNIAPAPLPPPTKDGTMLKHTYTVSVL